MKKQAALLGLCGLLAILPAAGALPAAARTLSAPAQSFPSYTYDYWGNPVSCPDPYTVVKRVTGVDLGIGNFKKPNDLFADADGCLYLAASGDQPEDNRIVKLDARLGLVRIYTGYTDATGAETPFREPLGVFVTPEGDIYVADGSLKQIIRMDAGGRLLQLIDPPAPESSASIDQSFVEKYRPSKVVVDTSGRLYVVAVNINQGIVQFDPDGQFEGFLAAGKVNANPIQLLWRKISTDAQRDRMADFVPIEYNNLALDEEGFIFATSAAINNQVVLSEIRAGKGTEQGALVRRLNMLGKDILRRKGYTPPVGDTDVIDLHLTPDAAYTGISQITDVACGENGTYILLDNNRSHIFTYDSEGYLLYAFGGPDVTAGGFRTPCSAARIGSALYVLDSNTRAITMLEQTAFARSIQEAIRLQETGDYPASAACWEEILRQNANYDLAYTGLGKAAYREGDYERAMELFQKGSNRDWYSRAYKEKRKQSVETWFAPVALAVLIPVCGGLLWGAVRKRRSKRRGDDQ